MAAPDGTSQNIVHASQKTERLEREVAELRRQLAVLYSQASDRLVVAAPDEEMFLYSEARYRALIELSPQAVWMTDRDGKNTYCNRYWYEFSGLTMESSVGLGWVQALHPDEGSRILSEWRSAVAKGAGYETEMRFRRRDGQYRWHLCRVQPLKDANGQITKWLGVSLDIHDRKVAATAIAQANERMLLAVESAQAGTWDFYPATRTMECSERCCKIFHVPPGTQPTVALFYSRLHPEDRDRVMRLLDAAPDPCDSGQGQYEVDYRIVLPDGRVRWIFAKGTCFLNRDEDSRESLRFSGLVFDITDRKTIERDRASLATAVRSSPDFISIADLKGQILFMNRAGRELVGLRDEGEAKLKTVFDFLGDTNPSILDDEILPLIKTGKVWDCELCMRHCVTRDPILVEARIFGIFDSQGRLARIANLSRDISEKKKSEEQRHLAEKMDAVGRLAAGIAHDFNNLLTIIRGSAEILLDRCQDNPHGFSTVKQIGDAAERAAGLTEQLLAFGRRQMVSPRPVDLNRAIRRVQSMLQRLVGEDIRLEVALDEDLQHVKMDPVQVDQILINLATNARDAMPRGGAITLCTFNGVLPRSDRNQTSSRGGCYACLSFTDTGTGMSLETQNHMFEPFYTTKPQGRGSGLGLSTVYGIVRQVGGQVHVRSAPGKGATFTLYLPCTSEALPLERAGQARSRAASLGTILLVEDEGSLRAIIAGYMREHGYPVHEAANADEATAIVAEHPIDLLVTDIVMPGASGPTLASTLVRDHADMKVIFMSGYADHDALQQALLQPNTLFLQKPFRLSDLIAKISQALTGEPVGNPSSSAANL